MTDDDNDDDVISCLAKTHLREEGPQSAQHACFTTEAFTVSLSYTGLYLYSYFSVQRTGIYFPGGMLTSSYLI